MEDQNEPQTDREFKAQLAGLFSQAPRPRDGEFHRLMTAYREAQGEPRWLGWVGSPVATAAAALAFVMAFSFSGNFSEVSTEVSLGEEMTLSWMTTREEAPLIAVLGTGSEE